MGHFDMVDACSQYKTYHLDKTNIKIHFLCVPIIQWTVLQFLAFIPLRFVSEDFTVEHIFFAYGITYWFILKWELGLGMLAISFPMHVISQDFKNYPGMGKITLAIFVVAWIGQFIGHFVYEKAKPAFFDDITQLFVGPVFLMSEFFFLFGWRSDLDPEKRDSIQTIIGRCEEREAKVSGQNV